MLHRGLSVLAMTVMVCSLMACGDKYDDAAEVNQQFAEATEGYVSELEKADSAEGVVKAIDGYTAKMEKIVPKMKAVADKYPELKDAAEVPENLRISRERAEEAGGKMAGAMMKMVQYMTDPKVLEAQQRMQKAMEVLTNK